MSSALWARPPVGSKISPKMLSVQKKVLARENANSLLVGSGNLFSIGLMGDIQ
jgi:hypothetical protein